MKNTKIRIIISATVLIALSILAIRWLTLKINSDFATEALLEFHYEDMNVSTAITDEEDIVILKQLLSGRSYFRDSLHCGFTTDISITMTNGRKNIIFCPANDGCQLLRIGTSGRYIETSYEAITKLHEILSKYGMVFPCV